MFVRLTEFAVSKIRETPIAAQGDLTAAVEGDALPYEVFVQLTRGTPHLHAGTVDAPDEELAMRYAREHYGRDQECVHLWVVPRSAILSTDYDHDLVWRHSDQTYRLARGYKQVRQKWLRFRDKSDLDEYQRDDLKQAF